MASLQHENILHVYDFVKDGGSMYIVMEYVQGIDLYDLLHLSGRLPVEAAAIIALQVARALDYAHYRGIIHRDIKPANVIISHTGRSSDGLGIAGAESARPILPESCTGCSPRLHAPRADPCGPLDFASHSRSES